MAKKVLFVNACIREQSRTYELCSTLLAPFRANPAYCVEEVALWQGTLAPLNRETLALRDRAAAQRDFSGREFHLAKQFAQADIIVVGAPYWDLSFPSVLKVYWEHVCVNQLTFRYDEEGRPVTLCRAQSLVYLATAGGRIGAYDSGKRYLWDMCDFFQIAQRYFHCVEGLDIVGADVLASLAQTKAKLHDTCAELMAQMELVGEL